MKLHRTRIGALGTVLLNVLATSAQNLSYGADNLYQRAITSPHGLSHSKRCSIPRLLPSYIFLIRLRSPNGSNYSAPVVSHPFDAVEEQGADSYAIKMAEQGFVTLSFDMPFWGRSSPKIHGPTEASFRIFMPRPSVQRWTTWEHWILSTGTALVGLAFAEVVDSSSVLPNWISASPLSRPSACTTWAALRAVASGTR